MGDFSINKILIIFLDTLKLLFHMSSSYFLLFYTLAAPFLSHDIVQGIQLTHK